MTQAWIDERRKLLAAATPGPWYARRGNVGADHPLFVEAGEKDGFRPWSDADAQFIASARNDYAALLDIAEAAMELSRQQAYHPDACSGCNEADARLRAALERAR